MTITYEERPDRFLGTGTVFIARDEGHVGGYWDALPDAPPAPLEPLPAGLTVRAAVMWGLERTARVLVRTETSGYVAVGPEAARFANEYGVEGVVTVAEVDDL